MTLSYPPQPAATPEHEEEKARGGRGGGADIIMDGLYTFDEAKMPVRNHCA